MSSATRHAQTRTGNAHRAGGFTLLETMLAMTITLVGVLAVLQAQRAFLFNNLWSTNAASAAYLAGEVREMTRALPRHDRFSGGLYFTTQGDPTSLAGFGPEPGEIDIEDFDDLDDFDGLVLGDATNLPDGFVVRTRFPGPIGADRALLEETDWSAQLVTEESGGEETAQPMQGWTQLIEVDLVDPFDYSLPASLTGYDPAVRTINEYPVRVTVTVLFQNQWSTNAPALTRVSWVVPP